MLRIVFAVRVPFLPTQLSQPQSSPVRLISKSVARRRRIRRIDIDSPEDPLIVFAELSKHPMQAKRGAKKKGLSRDSPTARTSKTLSWILRHGAKSEGITVRPDGYVQVTELLQNNRLRDLSLLSLEKIVKEDAKNRYSLICESSVWLIRANQGHSMDTVQMELQPIASARQIPMAVHGTTREAWRSICTQGLSRMRRNHIHLAQGIAGQSVISGMRSSSQILIYIDVQKALDSGLEFYLSANGVVLSEGDENGFIAPEYFRRVESANRMPLPGWEGPAAEIHHALVEDLYPAEVDSVDQAAAGEETDAQTLAAVSATPPADPEPLGLEERLRNVALK